MADELTPLGRKKDAEEGIKLFNSWIERKTSKDPEMVKWWNTQNLQNIARTQSVACEQTYLEEAKDPKSSYEKSLELC